jgi:hypothetical protein
MRCCSSNSLPRSVFVCICSLCDIRVIVFVHRSGNGPPRPSQFERLRPTAMSFLGRPTAGPPATESGCATCLDQSRQALTLSLNAGVGEPDCPNGERWQQGECDGLGERGVQQRHRPFPPIRTGEEHRLTWLAPIVKPTKQPSGARVQCDRHFLPLGARFTTVAGDNLAG